MHFTLLASFVVHKIALLHSITKFIFTVKIYVISVSLYFKQSAKETAKGVNKIIAL